MVSSKHQKKKKKWKNVENFVQFPFKILQVIIKKLNFYTCPEKSIHLATVPEIVET